MANFKGWCFIFTQDTSFCIHICNSRKRQLEVYWKRIQFLIALPNQYLSTLTRTITHVFSTHEYTTMCTYLVKYYWMNIAPGGIQKSVIIAEFIMTYQSITIFLLSNRLLLIVVSLSIGVNIVLLIHSWLVPA